jgi:hypothetical protein
MEIIQRSNVPYRKRVFQPTIQPQNVMSCMTCAAFGSPRVVLSCETDNRATVTAEAAVRVQRAMIENIRLT